MVAVSAAASGTKESNFNSNLIEDEATKRNTDCVYFLASPLTCKKGSECEYRHSEYARMNPRDCYYWLNGSCLNPKCAFRHPPLDSLSETQQPAASNGAALPLPHAKAPPQVAASQSKQVPCIFFQKGLCYKGDRCVFLHGPVPVATKPPQMTSQAAEVAGPKTIFGDPQRSAKESQVYQPNFSKSVKFNDSISVPKVFNGLPKAKTVAEKFVSQPGGFNGGSSSYNYIDTAPLSKTDTILVSNHMRELEVPDDHEMHNGKDAEDLYRESSPGFDVLVDDELAEGEYYDDGQYGTTGGGLEGGNANEYGAVPDADSEMFHDPQRYDGFDRIPGQYYKNQSRRSPERISRGSASLETRNNPRRSSSDRIDHSDLRYRLEQKKGSGLRSVIRNDYTRDNHERRSADYQRDSRIVSPLESSLNNRLQNRIRDTRRSPIRNSVSDIDNDRRRNLSRTSPRKSQIRERIGTRVRDHLTNDRTSRGYGTVKEGLEDGRGDFSGPKRLSELKGEVSVKNRLMSGRESFSLGKRKINDEHEQLDSNISFEGPKPLSEILKRKKMSKMNAEGSGSLENKESDANVSLTTGISQEEPKSTTDVSEKKTGPEETQVPNNDEVDQEEGMENQNMEACDDGEEYYYEEDGGEYYYEEGENAEGEYVEEVVGDTEKEMGDMQS